MNTEDYTADSICQSLGLGRFAPKIGPQRHLRMLLCPSFGPELCLTVTSDPRAKKVTQSVVVARTQIWSLGKPGLVTTDRADVVLDELDFDSLETDFRHALAERPASVVMLDGMPVHVVLRSYTCEIIVRDNPASRTALEAFVAAILARAHGLIDNPRCRDAIAVAGSYVGLKIPREHLPAPEALQTKLVVLGTPDEQAEFLAAVAKTAARPSGT